ncbi:hypothetical protein [Kribbella sp. NPDC048915]|uniref:hypothetical protein n=1 Tax=Kribbella sp. NPDC048915 TaxID=3155148 RepID=UPI0033FFBD39
MPLVDLDDPEELRARWTALAAVAHATGFDRRWYADADGYHHQDESASVLRMVRLGEGRAVLWGFHTQHSQTAGENLLDGSPDWIGQPEVRQRQDAGELGFVYGAFNGSWARASYPGDPWEPVEDGFAPIGAWITSDEATADVMSEWVAAWCDYLGGLDELRPAGVELIQAAAGSGISAAALGAYFGHFAIDPRSPVQPDLPAGVGAAEDFTRDYAPNVAEPATFADEPDTAEVSVVEDAVIGDTPHVEAHVEDDESYVVPPGISPFTGQPIEPAVAPTTYEGDDFFDSLFADAPAAASAEVAATPEDDWETAEQQPWTGPAWVNGEWVEDPSSLPQSPPPPAPSGDVAPADSPFAPGQLIPGDAVPANSPFARTQPLSPIDRPRVESPASPAPPSVPDAAGEFDAGELDDDAPTAEIEPVLALIASGESDAPGPQPEPAEVDAYETASEQETAEEQEADVDEPASFTGPSPFAPVAAAGSEPIVEPPAAVDPPVIDADDQTAEIPAILDDTEPPAAETHEWSLSAEPWEGPSDEESQGEAAAAGVLARAAGSAGEGQVEGYLQERVREAGRPQPESAMVVPGIGLVGTGGPLVTPEPGSLEEAMRAEVERPRPKPAESEAFRRLQAWCRARTKIVPSGFTIQVQVLDPAAPSYRFDLEPPEVADPEFAAGKLTELLGDLWLAEAESEQDGWLFARIDAAGRTVRIDRWYDQVPDWWDNPVEDRLNVDRLVRRLYSRGAEWQPSYLEKLYTSAR